MFSLVSFKGSGGRRGVCGGGSGGLGSSLLLKLTNFQRLNITNTKWISYDPENRLDEREQA